VISGLLRDGMGFDGLVLTDELKMGAISTYWGAEEAALLALQAGVDVVLADWVGVEQLSVFNSLVRACRAGQLAPGRLEQSVTRVLMVKLRYGLVSEALRSRYDELVRELGAPPPVEEPPAAEEMPTEGEPMEGEPMEGEMPAEETPVEPTPVEAPTPLPTPLSLQPTPLSVQPTPVSVQPTPTPPPTATRTSTPSPTATRTTTATATATRAP
jgi:hypothetical protein